MSAPLLRNGDNSMLETLSILFVVFICVCGGFVGMDFMLCYIREPFVIQWFKKVCLIIINIIDGE